MRIDGKAIADKILSELAGKIKNLGIQPTLAVILVGDNPASLAYIKQKQKAGEQIGARLILSNRLSDVEKFNDDPSIQGVIIQRPLPEGVGTIPSVIPQKDVDGFVTNSPFQVPVARAVLTILTHIGASLDNKKIVVIGRGETAGKPIASALARRQCTVSVIHSETPHPKDSTKTADILISCVGKRVVTADSIKPGVILISVGLSRAEDGLLHGDYDEEEIKDIARFYTPTPGGVGPVNVACLMQNLYEATSL